MDSATIGADESAVSAEELQRRKKRNNPAPSASPTPTAVAPTVAPTNAPPAPTVAPTNAPPAPTANPVTPPLPAQGDGTVGASDNTFVNPTITGRKFYFSNAGNDAYTLTQAQDPNTPWKTLKKLNEIMPQLKASDAALFNRGEVFQGGIKFSNITSAAASTDGITISTYGAGARPVFTGLTTAQWTNSGSSNLAGVYEAVIPAGVTSPNVLLIDGVSYPLSRFPEESDPATDGYFTLQTFTSNSINHGSIPTGISLVGANVVFKKNSWSIERHKITAHNGTSITFNIADKNYDISAGNGFFLQNHVSFFKKFGDWSYDSATRKISVYLGQKTPSQVALEIPQLENSVDIASSSNIKFMNIDFRGANNHFFNLSGTSKISVVNSLIRYAGGNGFSGDSNQALTLIQNSLYDVHANGVFLTGSGAGFVAQKNHFKNIGMYAGMSGINTGSNFGIQNYYTSGGNSTIEKNILENIGYVGITYGGSNNIIRFNKVKNYCLVKDDGGGIYTWNNSSLAVTSNNKIYNNIIADSGSVLGGKTHASSEAYGIYIDDGGNGADIYNNTIYNVKGAGMYLHNNTNLKVYNNTFFNNQIQLTITSDTLSKMNLANIDVSNNYFIAGASGQLMIAVNLYKMLSAGFATFKNNSYTDVYSVMTNFKISPFAGGGQKNATISQWVNEYGESGALENLLFNYRLKPIVSYLSGSMTPYGAFTSNAAEGYVWSAQGGATRSWVSASGLSTLGAVEINSPVSSTNVMYIKASIVANKFYQVKFNVLANKEAVLKAYIRMADTPYLTISNSELMKINTVSSVAEMYFKATASESAAILAIEDSSAGNLRYWMDNLEFREVTDPSQTLTQVKFIENNSSTLDLIYNFNLIKAALVLNVSPMAEVTQVVTPPMSARFYVEVK